MHRLGTGHFPIPTAVIVELTGAIAVILPLDRYGRPSGLARSAVGAVASLLSGRRMQAHGRPVAQRQLDPHAGRATRAVLL